MFTLLQTIVHLAAGSFARTSCTKDGLNDGFIMIKTWQWCVPTREHYFDLGVNTLSVKRQWQGPLECIVTLENQHRLALAAPARCVYTLRL